MTLNYFFYGKQGGMELTSFQWWNHKRIEYSLRFISCIVIAQILFLLTAFNLGSIDSSNIIQRIMSAFFTDAILLLLVNILYFLCPILEGILFKKIFIVYRKNCFAFLNLLNVLIVISALVIVFLAKT